MPHFCLKTWIAVSSIMCNRVRVDSTVSVYKVEYIMYTRSDVYVMVLVLKTWTRVSVLNSYEIQC